MSVTYQVETTFHAIRTVQIRRQCGRFAASQYARKHGVSGLYRLALQLEDVAV